MKDHARLKKNFTFNKIRLINFINLSSQEREILRTLRNHPKIRKWMYHDDLISIKEHRDFIRKLAVLNNDFYWIAKDDKGSYLGVVYLNKVDFVNKNAYLGIYSNPAFRGIGHTLIDCLRKLSFKLVKLHTLKLEVIETNTKAVNFYEKQGFKKEGKLKDFSYKDSKWQDVIIMGIKNKV